jgi:hypothetical protein
MSQTRDARHDASEGCIIESPSVRIMFLVPISEAARLVGDSQDNGPAPCGATNPIPDTRWQRTHENGAIAGSKAHS